MTPPLPAQDAEHLRMLSIAHYVVAGLQALVATFPVIHFLIGFVLFGAGVSGKDAERMPLALVGGLFMAIAGAFILAGWTLAVGMFMAGRALAERRRHRLCLVVAALEAAMCMPLGTVLGVFTLIVLLRPSVKAAFGVA